MAVKFLNGIEIDGTGTVFDVQGTQGQLFSVTDSLTGDLFSVSDISGVPILNVNSSGSITLDGTIDSSIIMPTAGSQVKIGSFTNGSNNSGEYANDDLVIGDGSISIYPHRRGDYALNETTATSTTFRSKLNIWSDAEDHITFGGANTHMVSAWEGFKIWINNDSAGAGTLYLYNKSAKTEFARFSGDASTSFITGKFFVNGELEATSLDINGAADISGNLTGVDTLTATTADLTGNLNFSNTARIKTSGSNKVMYIQNDISGTSYLRLGTGSADLRVEVIGTLSSTGNVTLPGIVLDGNTITGIDDSGEFTDNDAHIMTSAAVNDRIQASIIANTDTQDLSISGQTLSLTNGGSVTLPDTNTQLTLNNTNTSTSTTEAATANTARIAYNRGSSGITAANSAQTTANAALPKAGGTMTGDLTTTKIHLGNVDLYPSGDNNHLHFTGTAMIGSSTTASSNPKIGTSSYPFHQMHAGSLHGTTITASGELEGGSLDINGNGDISGNLVVGGSAHWDLSAGEYSGDPRALVTGYSGSQYGQIGYNVAFNSDGTHQRAFNDIPTRMTFHNGIVLYAGAAGSAGSTISWTEILEAQTDAFQYKGQDIYHTGNNSAILNSNVTSVSGNAGTVTNGVYTTGDQTINGNKTFNDSVTANQLNLKDGGDFLTFYGGDEAHHSISSRSNTGGYSDDLRINSFGAVHINLDSNSNNTSGADFNIGRHGGTTSTISSLFTLSGETGNATFTGNVTAGANSVTAGSFIIGGHTINDVDLNGEFVDSSEHLLTSAGAHDRFLRKTSHGTIGGTDVAFGTTTNWANNPEPGFYSTDYAGSSGLVFMTGDVGGSASSIGLEFNYQGSIKVHSNTDSSQWHTHSVWTENDFSKSSVLNSNVTSVSGSSGSCTGNAATATKISSITNSNIVQLTASQTLTNKTIAASQVTEISNITASEGAQLENIGSTTISATQWGYLGAATGAITNTDTNTQLSTEQVQDIVGAMVQSNSEDGISVAYQDGDGTLDFTVGTLNQNTTGSSASCTGNAATATTATNANNVKTTSVSNSAEYFGVFVDANGTGYQDLHVGAGLKYNPEADTLTTGKLTTDTAAIVENAKSNAALMTLTGAGAGNEANITLKLAGTVHGSPVKMKMVAENGDGNVNGNGLLSYHPTTDTFGIGQTTTHNSMAILIDNSDVVSMKNQTTFTNGIYVSSAVQSTSKTTGTVKIAGGVGIVKTLNVGEDVVAYASSDERYKDNLKPITNPIDKVKSLTGYTFTWNDKHEQFNGNDDIGVVAQEVEKVLPEIVDTRDNGYKAVKYEKMVALLIEAVKDQQKQIDELKAICNGCSK